MRIAIASLILAVGLAGPALAQEPAPAAPAAERPALPATGDGAAVLSVLTQACAPLVSQAKTIEQAAKDAGLRFNRRSGAYEGVLGQRPYSLALQPQGSNTNVCMVEIAYAVDQAQPIIDALGAWAASQTPELTLQRDDAQVGADGVKRITKAWEHYTDTESTGLVFSQLKNPDDTPLQRGYDQATLLYSERTF